MWWFTFCKIYCNKYRGKSKPILPFSLLRNCKVILKLGFMIYKRSYFKKSLHVKKLRKGDAWWDGWRDLKAWCCTEDSPKLPFQAPSHSTISFALVLFSLDTAEPNPGSTAHYLINNFIFLFVFLVILLPVYQAWNPLDKLAEPVQARRSECQVDTRLTKFLHYVLNHKFANL